MHKNIHTTSAHKFTSFVLTDFLLISKNLIFSVAMTHASPFTPLTSIPSLRKAISELIFRESTQSRRWLACSATKLEGKLSSWQEVQLTITRSARYSFLLLTQIFKQNFRSSYLTALTKPRVVRFKCFSTEKSDIITCLHGHQIGRLRSCECTDAHFLARRRRISTDNYQTFTLNGYRPVLHQFAQYFS